MFPVEDTCKRIWADDKASRWISCHPCRSLSCPYSLASPSFSSCFSSSPPVSQSYLTTLVVSGGQGWQWTEVSRQNFLSSTRPSANILASNALLEGESESFVTCMFPVMYIEQRLTISLDNTAARNLLHLTNICQHIFLLQLTLCNLDLGFTYRAYYVTIFMLCFALSKVKKT